VDRHALVWVSGFLCGVALLDAAEGRLWPVLTDLVAAGVLLWAAWRVRRPS
jgi:hypothetical protein